MNLSKLNPSSRIAEAEWIRRRLAPFASGVNAIVPGGFASYARILHPADDMRWADVAAETSRTMHRLVQFHAIDPSASSRPDPGNLAPELLSFLCSTLGEHTKTPNSCWFCLWEGYGWLHDTGARLVFEARDSHSVPADPVEKFETLSPVLRDAVLNKPGVGLPNRSYLLFEGPLEAATEFGWFLPSQHFLPQSPNLFWPDDHAWCVASEIDLFCTLVAGSDALIESLIADPRLEAWRVFADDPITADSDHVNL